MVFEKNVTGIISCENIAEYNTFYCRIKTHKHTVYNSCNQFDKKKKKHLYLYCVKNILLFAVFTKNILHGYGRELTFRAERSNIYFLFPRVNAFGKRTNAV